MIVFDVNIDVFQSLYMVDSRLPRRVLYQIQVPDQARRLGWKNDVFTGPAGGGLEPRYRLVRRIMFPGWFCTLGFLTMPWLARGALKHCREFLGGKPEIGVFYSPYYLPMQRALKPRITVYHPIDDYTVYWPKRAKRTLRLEDEMIHRADLVVCTGLFLRDELRARFPERALQIHHLPNPVPAEYLLTEPLPSTVFRGDGTDQRKPVLGYVGNFEYRLHAPVIAALAESLPWVEIKLRTNKPNPDPFAALNNVQYVESMTKDALMQFVRSFDVCLVPQAPNHFNYVASPRKMYEYLASSRPIVTLNTPEAAPLEPLIHNASSVADFVDRVRSILLQGEPGEYTRRRLALASELTAPPLANRYAGLIEEARSRGNYKHGGRCGESARVGSRMFP